MPDLTGVFRQSVEQRKSAREHQPATGARDGPTALPAQKRRRFAAPSELSDVYLREAYQIASDIFALKRYLLSSRKAYLSQRRPFDPPPSSGSEAEGSILDGSPLDPETAARLASLTAISESQKEARDLKAKQVAKQCMEKIAGLEDVGKALREKGSFTSKVFGGDPGADARASLIAEHRSSITWLLSWRLMEVTKIHAKQQEARVAKELERTASAHSMSLSPTATPRSSKPGARSASAYPLGYTSSPSSSSVYGINGDDARDDESWSDDGAGEDAPALTAQERQVLEAENEKMLRELEVNLDQVRQTEKSLLEISQLQTALSRHLAIQAAETERLHTDAIATTERVLQGNEYLQQARRHNADTRKWVLFFLIMASGVLLFLDWYD